MPNIVTVRGTNGSGKTYIAQQLITRLGRHASTLPLGPAGKLGGYVWEHPAKVTVLGRYETATGGCDGFTWLNAADEIEGLLLTQWQAGYNVFLEGLVVGAWALERYKRISRLTDKSLVIIDLATSLDDCIASVMSRRAARGNDKPFSPKNVIDKHRALATKTRNLGFAGLPPIKLDRGAALAKVCELMGVEAVPVV